MMRCEIGYPEPVGGNLYCSKSIMGDGVYMYIFALDVLVDIKSGVLCPFKIGPGWEDVTDKYCLEKVK